MKVTLLTPPLTLKERYGSLGKAGSVVYPLGLCYIASALERRGHEVNIIDGTLETSNGKDLLPHLLDNDIVGISSTTFQFHRAIDIAKRIKGLNSKKLIMLGGTHVSALPGETLSTRLFDFGIIGEGEITVPELLETIERGSNLAEVNGIAYLENNTVKITRPRGYIKELDTIPLPAWHLLPDLHLYHPNIQNYKRLPCATIITSRGCPYNCSFCDCSVFGKTIRLRSAANVVEEIKTLVKKYGIKELWVVDDTFGISENHATEFCKRILEEGLDVTWSCLCRVDRVSRPLLEIMKKAGCWLIGYGIESGNQKILDLVQKRISLEQIITAVNLTKEVGLKAKGFFMLGHPMETLETIEDTISFAVSLPLDYAMFTLTTPFPNTKLYEMAKEYGTLTEADWSFYSCWHPVYTPDGLTREILLAKQQEAHRRFYLRPGYLLNQMLSIRSFLDVKRAYVGMKAILG